MICADQAPATSRGARPSSCPAGALNITLDVCTSHDRCVCVCVADDCLMTYFHLPFEAAKNLAIELQQHILLGWLPVSVRAVGFASTSRS